MNIIHKNQRVGVFVDVQNMYYSAKNLYKSKVNFANILKNAVSNRNLIRAFAYVIKADVKEETNFFEALQKIGFEVRAKDLQIFYGGAKKGDWDIGIAVETIETASKLDVIVLVSGDGDFTMLVRHLRAKGVKVEIMSFKETTSSHLVGAADNFIDLSKDKAKYLIKKRLPPKK